MQDVLSIRYALNALFSEAGLPYRVQYEKGAFYAAVKNGEALNAIKQGYEQAGFPWAVEVYDTADKDEPILLGAAHSKKYRPGAPYCKVLVGSAYGAYLLKTPLNQRFKKLLPKSVQPAPQTLMVGGNDTLNVLSLHDLTLDYLTRHRPQILRALRIHCAQSLKQGL